MHPSAVLYLSNILWIPLARIWVLCLIIRLPLQVLVHETWLDTQQGHKGLPNWSGLCIIHERVLHDEQLRGYKLCELDGTIHWGTITLDHVKLFYYKDKNQTIKTYSASSYVLLSQVQEDLAPHIHINAYQHCVSLILAWPSSPALGHPAFDMEIPILNIGSAVASLGIFTTCHIKEEWEKSLVNISWDYPTNAGMCLKNICLCHLYLGDSPPYKWDGSFSPLFSPLHTEKSRLKETTTHKV